MANERGCSHVDKMTTKVFVYLAAFEEGDVLGMKLKAKTWIDRLDADGNRSMASRASNELDIHAQPLNS
jgi:hypothetical protein